MIIQDRLILSQPTKKVSLFDGLNIIKQLEVELAKSSVPGIGLSANQIGINSAVCIIRVNEKYSWSFINPQITELSDPLLVKHEGCLSFPEKWITTLRYNEVVIKDDLHPNGLFLWGIPAIVAQHEIDHCFGITMLDREVNPEVNKKCPCGSDKKFKNCCSGKEIVL